MKINRNEPCPCGSGKKYKHCCYATDSQKRPDPIEPDAAADAEPTDAEDQASAESADAVKREDHRKDRSRFQGDSRGKTNSFRPRATRGAQRGS